MLFGAGNNVIYGANDRGRSALGGFGGMAEQLDAAASGTRRLEMLAAVWARQTGRAIVVARGNP